MEEVKENYTDVLTSVGWWWGGDGVQEKVEEGDDRVYDPCVVNHVCVKR